jgi:hypothetical protein
VRLLEPAAAAFVSVAMVLLMGVFLPNAFLRFDLMRLLVGGGIAFSLALGGAWSGEKLMGNVGADDEDVQETARGRLRASLWAQDDGAFRPREKAGRE